MCCVSVRCGQEVSSNYAVVAFALICGHLASGASANVSASLAASRVDFLV